MNAADLLYSQGFGTRRHCIALVEEGFFQLNTLHGSDRLKLEVIKDPYTPVENWFAEVQDGPSKPAKGLEQTSILVSIAKEELRVDILASVSVHVHSML